MSSPPLHRSARSGSYFGVLTWADWTLLALFTAFLCFMCVVRSHGRLLWADELLGDRLLNRTSYAGMWRGWWEGADGGGPAYYLLGRLWVDVAGHSELALRLFSTLGMAAALLLVWALARRRFTTVSVAWSITLVGLYPQALRWQEVNGRFYGLFFASAALACLVFVVCGEREAKGRDLALLAVSNGLLTGAHILGFAYSFSLVATLALRDRWAKRYRPTLYCSAMAGWIVLAVAAHAIYRSTSIARHTFWTAQPGRHEFLIGLSAYNPLLLRVLLVMLSLALVKLSWRGALRPWIRRLPRESLAWLCLALLLSQMILFLKSRVGLSVYADRYLLPMAILTVLAAAASLDVLLFGRKRMPGAVVMALSLLALGPAAVYALEQRDLDHLYPKTGLPERMTANLDPGVPVLITLLPDFTLMERYDSSRQHYFLLDWPYDLVPSREATLDYSGQREMENWRRAGLVPGSILECPDVFAHNQDLYLFLDPGREAWMDDRLLHNQHYAVQKLGSWTEWNAYTLWRVRRLTGGPPC